MKSRFSWIFACACALAMSAGSGVPARAQEGPKEKPPMYSYEASWVIPRAQWAEMEKSANSNASILEKALADGTLVGYGSDTNEVHQPDGPTHDSWWSSMSMAGLLNVLGKFAQSGSSTSPVLASATKHWDSITVSRYYNWHSGAFKGAYTRVAAYKLKPDAPDHALDMLCKSLFVPLFEKLLADGTILEYEIDTEAIHTDNPAMFWIIFITPNAEDLDKFNTALQAAQRMSSLGGAAFESMIDTSAHRDYLESSAGIYK